MAVHWGCAKAGPAPKAAIAKADSSGFTLSAVGDGSSKPEIKTRFANSIAFLAPIGPATGSCESSVMQRRLLFYGPWSHGSGFGEAARGALRALQQLPEPWQVEAQAPDHWGPHAAVTEQRQRLPNGAATGVDPEVTWLHCNPDAACASLSPTLRERISRSRHVVATWVWESQQVPPSWHHALAWIDELWVPSNAVQQLLQPYTAKPVRTIPHAIALPARPATTPRERLILFVFDGASNLQRKNPCLLLDAFARSGLADQGWGLLLKTQKLDPADSNPALIQQFLERVQSLNQRWPGAVELLIRHLPAAEVEILFQRAAIVASPHTCEGFGLTLAEAMVQGCLVVATDHGGSRDWLDTRTGFPVPAPLQCIAAGWGAYPAGSVWADPGAEAFATALRQAASYYDDAAAAQTLRERARARISACCSPEVVSRLIHQALTDLVTRSRQRR